MQSNYILINKNNELLSFYYGDKKTIYCKKLGSDNYPITTKIISNVTDFFTINFGINKDIYIFCQSYDGDIILCKLEESGIRNKILFKNKSQMWENILFYPIFFKENMSLIYNNNDFLSIKTLIGGKNWTIAENIDKFSNLSNNLFYVQKINQDNFIIGYQKKFKDMQIGYKEIKNGIISDFVTIHKTGYQIVDYSFVAFNNTIHYLYIIKSLFSSQVIYCKKDEDNLNISNKLVLFEGQKIKSCSISILSNNLYCSFIVNSTLYYCKSEDFGNTFLGTLKYRKSLSLDIIKAKFIFSSNLYNSCINDIYIDGKNPLNLYMLPEFLPNLFNNSSINKENYNLPFNNKENFIKNLDNQIINNMENNTNNVESKYLKNIMPLEDDFMSNFNLEDFSKFNIKSIDKKMDNIDKNFVLQNKFNMLNKQLDEKNNQILKLNTIIQNKINEKTDIEVALRQKIKNMENENSKLLEKLNMLQNNVEMKNKNEEIDKNDEEGFEPK